MPRTTHYASDGRVVLFTHQSFASKTDCIFVMPRSHLLSIQNLTSFDEGVFFSSQWVLYVLCCSMVATLACRCCREMCGGGLVVCVSRVSSAQTGFDSRTTAEFFRQHRLALFLCISVQHKFTLSTQQWDLGTLLPLSQAWNVSIRSYTLDAPEGCISWTHTHSFLLPHKRHLALPWPVMQDQELHLSYCFGVFVSPILREFSSSSRSMDVNRLSEFMLMSDLACFNKAVKYVTSLAEIGLR